MARRNEFGKCGLTGCAAFTKQVNQSMCPKCRKIYRAMSTELKLDIETLYEVKRRIFELMKSTSDAEDMHGMAMAKCVVTEMIVAEESKLPPPATGDPEEANATMEPENPRERN